MKLNCSQMIGNVAENQYIEYDVYGKVTTIYSDAGLTIPVVEYSYDDKGFRYLVETPDGKQTFYVRDLSGNIISIYDDKITAGLVQKEIPIYGASRLGTVDLNSGWGAENYIYELSDHLGNVRATFTKDNDSDGKPDLLSYSDYYPGGMFMPGRQFVAGTGNYRFGYQGQFAEKDQETGFNHFELRSYDTRICRWMAPDPYGQYYSPYLGMGNNPVSGVDPDGGLDDKFYFDENNMCTNIVRDTWWHNLWNGHTGFLADGTTFSISRFDASNMYVFDRWKFDDIYKTNSEAVFGISTAILSESVIDTWLDFSGVNDPKNQRYIFNTIYALTESSSRDYTIGNLDFSESGKYNIPVLTLFDFGVGLTAFNAHNLGNFVWGAAMQRLNIDLNLALKAANLHATFKQGHIFGDSLDDQISIQQGYNWNNKR
ncbi:MAG: hypothetical protein KAT68_05550 [Bacteroidales bacterium]|nr:hypothetical protein [Bacteroidales bacterium]